MKRKIGWVALVFLLVLWATTYAAWAGDCAKDVASAWKFLADVTHEAERASESNQPRIKLFLEGARKLIDEAEADCRSAASPLAEAGVLAKLAIANGNLAAARIFIKLE